MLGIYTKFARFTRVLSLSFFLFQFRNQYDSDVTTWSPQGRLHQVSKQPQPLWLWSGFAFTCSFDPSLQVEYAMEAVKQGSATVGLKSKEFAVLAAFKRRPSDLASYQKKVRMDE